MITEVTNQSCISTGILKKNVFKKGLLLFLVPFITESGHSKTNILFTYKWLVMI